VNGIYIVVIEPEKFDVASVAIQQTSLVATTYLMCGAGDVCPTVAYKGGLLCLPPAPRNCTGRITEAF